METIGLLYFHRMIFCGSKIYIGRTEPAPFSINLRTMYIFFGHWCRKFDLRLLFFLNTTPKGARSDDVLLQSVYFAYEMEDKHNSNTISTQSCSSLYRLLADGSNEDSLLPFIQPSKHGTYFFTYSHFDPYDANINDRAGQHSACYIFFLAPRAYPLRDENVFRFCLYAFLMPCNGPRFFFDRIDQI